jgi:hypothetical protein
MPTSKPEVADFIYRRPTISDSDYRSQTGIDHRFRAHEFLTTSALDCSEKRAPSRVPAKSCFGKFPASSAGKQVKLLKIPFCWNAALPSGPSAGLPICQADVGLPRRRTFNGNIFYRCTGWRRSSSQPLRTHILRYSPFRNSGTHNSSKAPQIDLTRPAQDLHQRVPSSLAQGSSPGVGPSVIDMALALPFGSTLRPPATVEFFAGNQVFKPW